MPDNETLHVKTTPPSISYGLINYNDTSNISISDTSLTQYNISQISYST